MDAPTGTEAFPTYEDATLARYEGEPWLTALIENEPKAADFRCPLSKVVMDDPVVADDGITYNRDAIEQWFAEGHTASPLLRLVPIGKTLTPNDERAGAIRVARGTKFTASSTQEDESQTLLWDPHGLQRQLSAAQHRSLPLALPKDLVKPPVKPLAEVADLTEMFKVLEPLSDNPLCRDRIDGLDNLKPPKFVVLGDESGGKSTVLEHLIKMPLFPRKVAFCTRLPIHVHLRRPDKSRGEQPSVKMSVKMTEDVRRDGNRAAPCTEHAPETIAISAGFQAVQDKMDELVSSVGGTENIVSDRIIVLDVVHPEVPVLDLIDLPGMVTDDDGSGKKQAVKQLIDSQIEADRESGMTLYLLVVPVSGRPNTNHAWEYVQDKGLLDRVMGVFTKSDKVCSAEYLNAYITGGEVVNLEDDSTIPAKWIGAVYLERGWVATMLEMPVAQVTKDGKKINYYAHPEHHEERLKLQEENEKRFFGGEGAKEEWRETLRSLYDDGKAGTGALAAKVGWEYYEYSRGEWLPNTVVRLLKHELELKSERALLGETEDAAKDTLALEETNRTLDDSAPNLTRLFIDAVLLPAIDKVATAMGSIDGKDVEIFDLDRTLREAHKAATAPIDDAKKQATSHYAKVILRMLKAPTVVGDKIEEAEAPQAEAAPQPVPALQKRFWGNPFDFNPSATIKRLLFGKDEALPTEPVELHKKVIQKKIIQLDQYPDYCKAVADAVASECGSASDRIGKTCNKILDHIVNLDTNSKFVTVNAAPDCMRATISVDVAGLTNAIKVAFMRYLPEPEMLKEMVQMNPDLKLSKYDEDPEAKAKRDDLDRAIKLVHETTSRLIKVLDKDETKPLNREWLKGLQEREGLPIDDPVV